MDSKIATGYMLGVVNAKQESIMYARSASPLALVALVATPGEVQAISESIENDPTLT